MSNDQTPNPTQGSDVIPKAEYEKLSAEFNRIKKTAVDTQAERDDLKARLEALEHKKTEDGGDFKKLAETYKSKLDETEQKLNSFKSNVIVNEKHKAASAALVKAGLLPEALRLLDKEDFADIEVEVTNNGRFLSHGVDIFVENFKKSNPYAFAKASPPKVNNGSGGRQTEGDSDAPELTHEYMYELEKKDPKKWREMWPKFMDQWRAKRNQNNRTV
jgi:hypothetical protein